MSIYTTKCNLAHLTVTCATVQTRSRITNHFSPSIPKMNKYSRPRLHSFTGSHREVFRV